MIRFLLIMGLMTLPAFAGSTALEQAKQDMNAGRYANALATLQSLVDAEQDNYEAWFLFGVAQVHEQRDHQAIEAFRHVTELRPTLAEPHNNLAAVYNNLGDTKAAIKELEIALEKRPNYAVAEENLADLHVKLALQHYRNSLNHGASPAVEQRYARLLKARNPSSHHAASNDDIVMNTQPKATKPVTPVKPAPETTPAKPADTYTAAAPITATPSIAEDKSITGVLDALETWRSAWSSQDLKAYFAAYGDEYTPDSRFADIAAWKAYKTRVIKNKTFINVQFKKVEVDIPTSRDMATISILQHFRSNTYAGDDRKEITMKYTPDGWKIISEVSLP